MDLKDKTILVTGAASGIGQAIAIACAQKGAIILINDKKNIESSQQTLKEVEKYSGGYAFQADLADEGQVGKMFKDISEKVRSVDVLVNNAGDAQPGEFFDNNIWKYQIENIFFSALCTSQHFLKQNANAKLRKIVNITSYYGNLGGGNTEYFAYSVAKTALSSMTVTLAKVDSKVLVNAIAPGYTWTPAWESTSDAEKKICESRTMINRFVTAEEIAQAVVGVLENDAMTGQIITVDGGLSLQKLERK
ncbi:MAG: glucose 1-dehydrogenase [Parcubacteria group bacterium Greene0714_21]|nr:MAG: glucose 1-dehydrogenase [Parcubacteria group bacterium Greene0416_39]TSC97152.1 MAG: glucose 1-dehydrogenase [Parcubacteria group bacterium Greene1014_47]TSD03848.1 MAG: glucose 1-dehydrogenase [Parcubacteria group bacterium Greene0714_21]